MLDIGERDYRLGPLNPYFDIARERIFVIQFGSGL